MSINISRINITMYKMYTLYHINTIKYDYMSHLVIFARIIVYIRY